MSTSHTPGPWSLNTDWALVMHGKSEICAIHSGNMPDARLITAAPDLLEALEWALDQIDDDLDPDHQAALKAAHNALKRAKGQQ